MNFQSYAGEETRNYRLVNFDDFERSHILNLYLGELWSAMPSIDIKRDLLCSKLLVVASGKIF